MEENTPQNAPVPPAAHPAPSAPRPQSFTLPRASVPHMNFAAAPVVVKEEGPSMAMVAVDVVAAVVCVAFTVLTFISL